MITYNKFYIGIQHYCSISKKFGNLIFGYENHNNCWNTIILKFNNKTMKNNLKDIITIINKYLIEDEY